MTPRIVQENAFDGEWTLVSAKHPCAVCGCAEGCRRGFGDQFACCVRTVSDWPLTIGGWLHRVAICVDSIDATDAIDTIDAIEVIGPIDPISHIAPIHGTSLHPAAASVAIDEAAGAGCVGAAS